MKYGFVYIWHDRKRRMYYIGSHWGTEDDGYICSSNKMRKAYRRRPSDFKRRILISKIDNRYKCFEEEYKWLQLAERKKHRYYNLHFVLKEHWHLNNGTRKSIGEKISQSHKKNPNWGKWNKGLIRSEESKELNRQKHLGIKQSTETKLKRSLSLKGQKRTQEQIEKFKLAQQKRFETYILSEDTKKRMGRASIGNKYRLGIKHTNESKQKISNALKGKPSPNKGKKMSEDQKRKISESLKLRFINI